MISSRIPLLAVVDENNNISGVITATDLLIHTQKILKNEKATLEELKIIQAKDIIDESKNPVSVTAGDDLQAVTEAMIKYQYSKIFVTEDGK